MMGYKRGPRIYKLIFDDPEYEGLEVRASSLTIRKLREIVNLRGLDSNNPHEANKASDRMFSTFADCLISWNLEDELGNPVPATLEGIENQETDFIMPIIGVWMDTITGATGPLDQTSSDGELFPVGSIPMETLSPNPQS